MSLSGELQIFPLDEVLRLLARSNQTGCLRVDGEGAGSIYLVDGSLTYASTETDEVLREQLVAGGIVTADGIRQVATSNSTLADALAPDASTTTLTEAIREQSVESVYRIRRPLAGPFSFTVDMRPGYATGQRFDVEMIISEANRRAAEWAEIEKVVPDLTARWRMVPSIDEESVQVSDAAWSYLAAMEGGSSVEEISRRLGKTKFQAAQRTAELALGRLIEVVPVAAPTTVTYEEPAAFVAPEPTPTFEPAPAVESQVTYDEPVVETPVEAPVETPVETSTPDPDKGWWNETTEEATPAEVPASELDTPEDEGFLEKVFGELEQTDSADDSSEGDSGNDDDDAGFGLLRRRGLGAAFRELADS